MDRRREKLSSICNREGLMTAAAIDSAPSAEERRTADKLHIDLSGKIHPAGTFAFFLVLVAGAAFAVFSIASDIRTYGGGEPIATGAFLLLGLALLIALGFEFVNGFHDTANAVATVIYTRSLPPLFAVVWSGFFNFLGVALSTGAVAYSIVTMLPIELILQTGSAGGYAMIFSLLLAAVIWNLGTWWFGIPNSSSHALIGSILGVGLANQLLKGRSGASGVDWSQAGKIIEALLFSPICGFALAALLLLAFKVVLRNRTFFEPADPSRTPPWWIRGLLILTCTGVSFAHGGNDGQKGMGIIMLILIGVAPTAYALNRTMPDSATPKFLQTSEAASKAFLSHANGASPPSIDVARRTVDGALSGGGLNKPETFAALSVLSQDIETQVKSAGAVRKVPAAQTQNVRNEMYLTAQAISQIGKKKIAFADGDAKTLKSYGGLLNNGTRFIPFWVKITVALALGLGTMIGWKRIVVTVGEKIGKDHLSYGQGASAEIVAAVTIGGAEYLGLPVSTTHILSSGVAGTMVANGSGLQMSTIRNIALAWVLTLPAAITLAGVLYAALSAVLGGLH
jgi:inorganic phosphate transporter, PiT family